MHENEAKRFDVPWPNPNQGKGPWKLYNMVEVNDAYEHGRYEKIGWKVCM